MVKYTRRGERERERKKTGAERFALDLKDIFVFDICNKNTHFLIKALRSRTEREREREVRFSSSCPRIFFPFFVLWVPRKQTIKRSILGDAFQPEKDRPEFSFLLRLSFSFFPIKEKKSAAILEKASLFLSHAKPV